MRGDGREHMRLASDLPNLRDVPDIELHHHGHVGNEPAGCLKSLDNSNPQWMCSRRVASPSLVPRADARLDGKLPGPPTGHCAVH